MSNVLVVDDEEQIREILRRTLANEGHSVVEAADGASALVAATDDVDLILLDLVMPGLNGLQVLSALSKRARGTPVVVLSGVDQVSARVQALDIGAVDFVAKPFHAAELLARVRRHLAHDSGAQRDPRSSERYLDAGGVRLDLERRRAASEDGPEVVLSEREFALLAHLMRRRGSVCRRDELLHDVWGLEFDPASNVVEVAVRRLRKHLADPPIETVRGVGYCFVGA